jgi:F0F1-type ATP synthase membrane subunit c/vacuolar-type H+-ATPase subunit K
LHSEANDDPRKIRFIWGLVLAWAPAIPLGIGLSNVFRGLSEQKATGLGAVAGGFIEAYFMFGLVAAFAFQVGGIVLLMKPPAGQRILSFASIAWSIFMLILFAFFLWLNFVYLRHH